MTDPIDYNTATAAQKLADAIMRFGIDTKLLREDATKLTGPQLLQVLDDARLVIGTANELVDAAKALGRGIEVEIFWERQGYYFVDVADRTKVSEEFESLDACTRYVVLHGYKLVDIHKTRRSVRQPTPPRSVGGE